MGRGRRAALGFCALAALAVGTARPAYAAESAAAVQADRQALTQGLQAQFEVALIRERKEADDRESALIGQLETKLKAARAQADAAKGDARAANAALAQARADYAKLAGQLAAKDPDVQAQAVAYQTQTQAVVAQASPEKLAALQRFADGDRTGAWPTLLALTTAEMAAPGVTVAQQAKDERDLANLRDIMRAHGEASTTDVLDLYDKAAALDPSHFHTQIERARLAHDAGDLTRARTAAQQALQVATEDGERAQALQFVGEQASDQHDYKEAHTDYDQSLAIFRREAAVDTAVPAQENVAAVLQDKGDLQVLEGDFKGAQVSYFEALDIRGKLADANPTNSGIQDLLTSVYQRIGDLDEKVGDLKDAQNAFQQGLAIRQKLSDADPTNTDLQYYTSAFLRRLGDIALARNDMADARKQYEATLAIRQRLAEADPGSAQLQNAVALDLEDLAGVAFNQNDLATARADYAASLAIRKKLAAADPTNAAMQQLILRAMARSARITGGVTWEQVADQYAKIEKAGQLTPGDEKVLQALKAHGASAGL